MSQSIQTQRAPRRAQTPAQRAVTPLAPIFAACKSRGLSITPDNKAARLRAVNAYLNWLPFDWIEVSFKELCADRAAVLVVADAIEAGCLKW